MPGRRKLLDYSFGSDANLMAEGDEVTFKGDPNTDTIGSHWAIPVVHPHGVRRRLTQTVGLATSCFLITSSPPTGTSTTNLYRDMTCKAKGG
jgi:hypothetical protein